LDPLSRKRRTATSSNSLKNNKYMPTKTDTASELKLSSEQKYLHFKT